MYEKAQIIILSDTGFTTTGTSQGTTVIIITRHLTYLYNTAGNKIKSPYQASHTHVHNTNSTHHTYITQHRINFASENVNKTSKKLMEKIHTSSELR